MRADDGTVCTCMRLPSAVLDKEYVVVLAFAECRHYVGDGCEPDTSVGPVTGQTDLACAYIAVQSITKTTTFQRVKLLTLAGSMCMLVQSDVLRIKVCEYGLNSNFAQ